MSLIRRRNKQDHECLLECVARMLSKLCCWPGVLRRSGLWVSGEQSNACVVQLQGNPSSLSTLESQSWVRRGGKVWDREPISLDGQYQHFLSVLPVEFQCISHYLFFHHLSDKNQTDLKTSPAPCSTELWFTLPLIHCCEKWAGILLWI